MKLISKCLVVFMVVSIALTFNLLCHTQNTEHATVELIETKITAHKDTPIIIGNHSLEYIVIQGDMVYGVPVDE